MGRLAVLSTFGRWPRKTVGPFARSEASAGRESQNLENLSLVIAVWKGFPRELAEARAVRLAGEENPKAQAVVVGSAIAGIDWIVRLWVFVGPGADAPQEVFVRVRGTDGQPLGLERRP